MFSIAVLCSSHVRAPHQLSDRRSSEPSRLPTLPTDSNFPSSPSSRHHPTPRHDYRTAPLAGPPAMSQYPGSRMFVPPRHLDDPATFNLWTGEGGEFRGLAGDELSWIQKANQCTSILYTSPFIVLYGARIKNYWTLRGRPSACGDNPSPAKRGTIGNPRMADPMTDFVGLDVFTSGALAFLLEVIPGKV